MNNYSNCIIFLFKNEKNTKVTLKNYQYLLIFVIFYFKKVFDL